MKTYSNEEGAEMEELRFNSVFDIIGPVMIGPSSSHTAGAARIGKVVRSIFGQQPDSVDIYLYESFAKTYRGHGTDIALVGGLLGMEPDDEQLSILWKLPMNKEWKFVLFLKVKKQTTLIPLKLWFLLATENYL